MKHYLLSAFLILSTLIGLTSCSKESSSNSSYLGKWKLSGVMGHGALTEITSMTIKESTVTMTFDKEGYYGSLYKEYGPSNTVNYTYNPHDIDMFGKECASLTFDSPLFIIPYSTKD